MSSVELTNLAKKYPASEGYSANQVVDFNGIDKAPEEKKRGVTINWKRASVSLSARVAAPSAQAE